MKLKSLLITALLFAVGSATQLHAQEEMEDVREERAETVRNVEETEVTDTPDILPVFYKGSDKMLPYIAQNLRYPQAAIEANAQGVVLVAFVVTPKGRVSNVSVKKSPHEALSTEAVRIVNTLRFKPGRKNGKKVSVKYSLPIRFSLSE